MDLNCHSIHKHGKKIQLSCLQSLTGILSWYSQATGFSYPINLLFYYYHHLGYIQFWCRSCYLYKLDIDHFDSLDSKLLQSWRVGKLSRIHWWNKKSSYNFVSMRFLMAQMAHWQISKLFRSKSLTTNFNNSSFKPHVNLRQLVENTAVATRRPLNGFHFWLVESLGRVVQSLIKPNQD